MSAKRGASGLSGILLVDKPAEMTSHDVVAIVRRAAGERRVGHAGTLDPMATGLLVVLVGPATRLEPYLSSARKTYEAQITFGSATDTEDAEGNVISEAAVDPALFDAARAKSVLNGLVGESMQTPPTFSAIKVEGRTAHRAAREGNPIEMKPRPITVHSATLMTTDPDARTWRVTFDVSKGTYIRSLARDLGLACGTVAHLSGLRRTESGGLSITEATQLDDLRDSEDLIARFVAPRRALPSLNWTQADMAAISSGRPVNAPVDSEQPDELFGMADADGALAALYRRRGDRLVPEVVFAVPVRGAA